MTHYQVFPFEKEHDCRKDRYECVRVGGRCIQKRIVLPSTLDALNTIPAFALNTVPQFIEPETYLLRIDFPVSRPATKLIRRNGRTPTLRQIIHEFCTFYRQLYRLEQDTLEEEKVIIECIDCQQADFSTFPRNDELDRCFMCAEETRDRLQLLCGHIFHTECITKWFREQNNCPLCRQPIKPCSCNGQRETLQAGTPSLSTYIDHGIPSTGHFRIEPYDFDDLFFTCIVYDRHENVFSMRHFLLV